MLDAKQNKLWMQFFPFSPSMSNKLILVYDHTLCFLKINSGEFFFAYFIKKHVYLEKFTALGNWRNWWQF
jgi:hypothetical protein